MNALGKRQVAQAFRKARVLEERLEASQVGVRTLYVAKES
jgi:hypothetical protein